MGRTVVPDVGADTICVGVNVIVPLSEVRENAQALKLLLEAKADNARALVLRAMVDEIHKRGWATVEYAENQTRP